MWREWLTRDGTIEHVSRGHTFSGANKDREASHFTFELTTNKYDYCQTRLALNLLNESDDCNNQTYLYIYTFFSFNRTNSTFFLEGLGLDF